MENRPTSREKNVTGEGKPVYKREPEAPKKPGTGKTETGEAKRDEK